MADDGREGRVPHEFRLYGQFDGGYDVSRFFPRDDGSDAAEQHYTKKEIAELVALGDGSDGAMGRPWRDSTGRRAAYSRSVPIRSEVTERHPYHAGAIWPHAEAAQSRLERTQGELAAQGWLVAAVSDSIAVIDKGRIHHRFNRGIGAGLSAPAGVDTMMPPRLPCTVYRVTAPDGATSPSFDGPPRFASWHVLETLPGHLIFGDGPAAPDIYAAVLKLQEADATELPRSAADLTDLNGLDQRLRNVAARMGIGPTDPVAAAIQWMGTHGHDPLIRIARIAHRAAWRACESRTARKPAFAWVADLIAAAALGAVVTGDASALEAAVRFVNAGHRPCYRDGRIVDATLDASASVAPSPRSLSRRRAEAYPLPDAAPGDIEVIAGDLLILTDDPGVAQGVLTAAGWRLRYPNDIYAAAPPGADAPQAAYSHYREHLVARRVGPDRANGTTLLTALQAVTTAVARVQPDLTAVRLHGARSVPDLS